MFDIIVYIVYIVFFFTIKEFEKYYMAFDMYFSREDKNLWLGETQSREVGFFRSEHVEEVLDYDITDGTLFMGELCSYFCQGVITSSVSPFTPKSAKYQNS